MDFRVTAGIVAREIGISLDLVSVLVVPDLVGSIVITGAAGDGLFLCADREIRIGDIDRGRGDRADMLTDQFDVLAIGEKTSVDLDSYVKICVVRMDRDRVFGIVGEAEVRAVPGNGRVGALGIEWFFLSLTFRSALVTLW